MNNKILIIGGDPNSVNSEIIYKTWSKLDFKVKKKIYLIANFALIQPISPPFNRSIESLKHSCAKPDQLLLS